jgi:hypothetical protein
MTLRWVVVAVIVTLGAAIGGGAVARKLAPAGNACINEVLHNGTRVTCLEYQDPFMTGIAIGTWACIVTLLSVTLIVAYRGRSRQRSRQHAQHEPESGSRSRLPVARAVGQM